MNRITAKMSLALIQSNPKEYNDVITLKTVENSRKNT